MNWAILLKYGAVIAVIGGIVYWIADQRYDAGVLAGMERAKEACEERVKARDTERDKEELEKLRRLEQTYKQREADTAEFVRQEREELNAGMHTLVELRDRALTELRAARAARRNSDSNSRLSQASGTGQCTGAVSGGILSERGEADLIERAREADELNRAYQFVLRAYRNLRDGSVAVDH